VKGKKRAEYSLSHQVQARLAFCSSFTIKIQIEKYQDKLVSSSTVEVQEKYYMEVIEELEHETPVQFSPHGSPPVAFQPVN
jgi:hypothetical protein